MIYVHSLYCVWDEMTFQSFAKMQYCNNVWCIMLCWKGDLLRASSICIKIQSLHQQQNPFWLNVSRLRGINTFSLHNLYAVKFSLNRIYVKLQILKILMFSFLSILGKNHFNVSTKVWYSIYVFWKEICAKCFFS